MKVNLETIKKFLIDWGMTVAAAAIISGVDMLTTLAPQWTVLIGSVALPATRWASKRFPDYGRK